jgi:hypothetical protein
VEWSQTGGWNVDYIYVSGTLLAQYGSGGTGFVHRAHLGSTRLITGPNQSFFDSMDYLPYGEQILGGTWTTHKFTGKEHDAETQFDDLNAKNRAPPIVSYKGLDPAKGVPGLYWINLFSEAYAKWLGVSELPRELAVLDQLADRGVRLKFCESPDDCRNLQVLQRQRAAIDWLGPQRFFDARFLERKQEVPDWNSIPLPNAESAVRETGDIHDK